MPRKLKDPGTPTITCIIGNCTVDRALLDLGAIINLLPYSVYKLLGLGELTPTSTTLQLADRSIILPKGRVNDVIVQVERFYYPADFVVIDTEPVEKARSTYP